MNSWVQRVLDVVCPVSEAGDCILVKAFDK